MTSGQEMKQIYSYNLTARTGPMQPRALNTGGDGKLYKSSYKSKLLAVSTKGGSTFYQAFVCSRFFVC